MTTPTAEHTVALVDDDPNLRIALACLMRSVGYTVKTFVSAEHFLQAARQEAIHCLVLDMRLPGMSGLELLRHLRATGSHIEVVFVTGQTDDRGRMLAQAVHAGARTILQKPLDPEQFLGVLQSICDEYPGTLKAEQVREDGREARRR
jgi:FixJ family two-component response regulator